MAVTEQRGTTEPVEPEPPFANHVEQRTVVLPELRVLFLPMPKAGCTSVLWRLAALAGIPLETFAHSALPEVSPALAVHDMKLWGTGHRLADYEGNERERILSEEGWLRFTLVRDPATRLWSAWQSKLLLREPRFVADFAEEAWFPRLPEEPAALVEDFRRFVAALPGDEVEDVHWAVQHDLAVQLPLTHVGRVERLDDTLSVLRAHVPGAPWPDDVGRDNRTSVPMPPGLYDKASAQIVRDRYRADYEHYGYDPVEPAADGPAQDAWAERVAPLLPLLREQIDRHVRIGELQGMAWRVQNLERRLENAFARRVGHASAPVFANLEGHTEFNVRWAWSEERLEPGFTAVVRVKNEARALPWVLPPLLRAVQRVEIVDNGSTDGTGDVALAVAEEEDAADRLEVRSYPFSVARCGPEHLGTPAGSVHNLAYFYNWAFSHVRTGYALKWDGDMVLTDSAVELFRDLAWQLEASDAVVKIPRYPLYLADDRKAFFDVGMSNCEPWAWPNKPGYSFVKAMEWEQPVLPPDVPRLVFPEWGCIELKHLDADEFAHWSDTDFDASARTRRKRREWEVFHALVDGAEPPADVVAVEAPEGRHVIEYVRTTWLPEQAREPGDLGERLLGRLVRAAV
ncbi:MAG TPA: sulfotransferase family 2 domain-containing protein [Gaiellaceae bacterium]|nr:sulfotransferase family 2 domain-containing protein [Gaiellaceae bacterium]